MKEMYRNYMDSTLTIIRTYITGNLYSSNRFFSPLGKVSPVIILYNLNRSQFPVRVRNIENLPYYKIFTKCCAFYAGLFTIL